MREVGPFRSGVLFIFLDGVGLARAGPGNPFSQIPTPALSELLGGPLVQETAERLDGARRVNGRQVQLRAIDACLGMPGLPQSATGQASLFTGINAPVLAGDHVPAFPTAMLREVIAEHSLLRRGAESGNRVVFANAHSERFWETVAKGGRRLGASTLTAMAAGAPIPTLQDLREGQAVLWDITHEIATRYLGYELPEIAAEEAGARLVRLMSEYDLVLYETFLTDLAGHRRLEPGFVLHRLDAFLGSVISNLGEATTLVISSDHGNLEDMSTKAHTRNPVPLLVVGPGAESFSEAHSIVDIAPGILSLLEAGADSGPLRRAGE